jgi:mRNA-degrading endonuclease toxin of MazEF toxin-antitoxin module
MNRGEIWLAQVGRKQRPIVILTRSEVIDVRSQVTVAEITTNARGLSVEVELDAAAVGLSQPSVINCDGLHTVSKSMLATYVGTVDDATLDRVCAAVAQALGC